MTEAECRPVSALVPIVEREGRADRFGELLEHMADLRVEVCRQRVELGQRRGGDDPRVGVAIARLAELERSLGDVGVEAASVHQLLRHVRLI